MTVLSYLNPFTVFREFLRKPVESFVVNQYTDYRHRTKEGINSVKELLYRAGIILVFLTAILWISVFLYVVFYYTYMPNVTHIRPVHLQFKSCDEQMGVCSFPSAHVQLTKRSRMLMSAQPYRVRLLLEMPESQINKDLGMIMVCAQMRAKGGVLVSSSCRSAMLRHRSPLLYIIRTLVFAPLFLSGLAEEKQQLFVELFNDFEDDQELPVTDAYVELQSRFAQVYSCELHIEAHFAGLRYLMFNWPKTSALIGGSGAYLPAEKTVKRSCVPDKGKDMPVKLQEQMAILIKVLGISTNLFFVSLIFVLSWYHLQDGLPEFVKRKFGASIKSEDDKKLIGKVKLEKKDSNYFEDEALFQEFKHLTEDPKKKT